MENSLARENPALGIRVRPRGNSYFCPQLRVAVRELPNFQLFEDIGDSQQTTKCKPRNTPEPAADVFRHSHAQANRNNPAERGT